jgi:hypothetical protein
LLLGVAVALYPVGCETTLRGPGGAAGVRAKGTGGADATSHAGGPSAPGGGAGILGAGRDGESPTAAGSGGRATEDSSSLGGHDEPAGEGVNVSPRGGTGSSIPSGAGGRGEISDDGGDGGAADIFDVPPRCTSGRIRDPNESESPEMNPGFACNQCHTRVNADSGEGDAPIFAFAGTAFPSAHEPSSCIASDSEGAEVVVTDAEGTEFSAVANEVGNFFLEQGALAFPITARIVAGGRARKMENPVPFGDCNLCHTQVGTRVLADGEQPPGRVVLP